MTKQHVHTNRLIHETSPYLLQHAHNPVDWYPWSEEAFARAEQEDKPIFLSVGYSTCHWCHVMERESFENEEIAAILNEHFVSIKVDREQRPDVDAVYMEAVQAMSGSGGWPMSVFLAPDGRAFFGGTYFPPEDRYGRPGFKKLLLAIARGWAERREGLLETADKLKELITRAAPGADGRLDVKVLTSLYQTLSRSYDPHHGGFGQAPKFPQPSFMDFLLVYWHRTGEPQALAMVLGTLDAMADGGIYDHLGGGFHRYATDADWLVPHFEKMLYDQAQIVAVLVDAYKITKRPAYARVIRETLNYVLRDLRDPDGAFYSAEDADSEGREGAFYVWTPAQTRSVLGEDSARVFDAYYGITAQGNFEHQSSILSVVGDVNKLADQFDRTSKRIDDTLLEARKALFKARSERVRPHRDEKIITAWNGLMISALASAGTALSEQTYIDAAEQAAEYILRHLRHDGRLMRSMSQGRVSGPGFLDDYAFLTAGLMDLYEATFDLRWLKEADALAKAMIELFDDPNGGAFFMVGRDSEQLWVRSKPDYDGAVPSGNSVGAGVLLKLGRLTMNSTLSDKGEQILRGFADRLQQAPAALTVSARALSFSLGPSSEITLAGSRESRPMQGMMGLLHRRFFPNKVVVYHPNGSTGQPVGDLVPFIKEQVAIDGKATAYICENYACRRPIQSEVEFAEALRSLTRSAE